MRRFEYGRVETGELHARVLKNCEGEVATYIPALGKADPSLFGLALATHDGHVYESGDTSVGFTIQSVSKPFVYALALYDRGLNGVLERVGVEPTGEGFDALRLEPDTGRPLNPMVNAGAIVTASLVNGDDWGQRFQRILDGLSAFAGRQKALPARGSRLRSKARSQPLRSRAMRSLPRQPPTRFRLRSRPSSKERPRRIAQ